MYKNASHAREKEEWEPSSTARGTKDDMSHWESIVVLMVKSEHMHIPDLASSLPVRYIRKRNSCTSAPGDMDKDDHSGRVHKNPQLETAQIFISRRMHASIMECYAVMKM